MFVRKANIAIRLKDPCKEIKYQGVLILKKDPYYLVVCKNPEEFTKICTCEFSLGQKNGADYYYSCLTFIQQTIEIFVEDSDSIRSDTIKQFLTDNATIFALDGITYKFETENL